MASKKSKKDADTKGAGKESDAAFLQRIMKIKDDATAKASEELGAFSKTEEVEKIRATGRQAAKDLEEIEECEKIAEEFKVNPPIAVSKHINGISVEYYYEDRFKTRIELLKKHGFGFLNAVKSTSIESPTFTTYGRAYVKRGGQKIPLPESAIPPTEGMGMGSRLLNPKDSIFVLEDGDAIETGNDGYVYVKDFRSSDKYRREFFVFPNSEAKLILTRKETHPEPVSMDPSQVPDAIKRNSSATVIEYNFVAVSLNKGIFQVDFLDENMDVNKFLRIASGYPEIEFLHSSKMVEEMVGRITSKLPKDIAAKYAGVRSWNKAKVCDAISAYIELCNNNSLVIFGTPNSVKNKATGKTASPSMPKLAPKDFVITGKMTVVGDKLYSDAPGEIDQRARAIIKNRLAVDKYASYLNAKKEQERAIKEIKEKLSEPKVPETEASKKEKEQRKAELKEKQKYYKQVGDTVMAEAVQMQLDELEPKKINPAIFAAQRAELLEEEQRYRKEGNILMADSVQMQLVMLDPTKTDAERAVAQETFIKEVIGWCDKEIAKLKPDLDTRFPHITARRQAMKFD